MSITPHEAQEFLQRFLDCVFNGGTPAQQASYFLHKNARLFDMRTGSTISLEDQYHAHQNLKNENASFGNLQLTPMHESPERSRVLVSLYWEATQKDTGGQIKATVEDDIIIERMPSDALKFVFFGMNAFHFLPGSATLD
jgi:hypothetical protein